MVKHRKKLRKQWIYVFIIIVSSLLFLIFFLLAYNNYLAKSQAKHLENIYKSLDLHIKKDKKIQYGSTFKPEDWLLTKNGNLKIETNLNTHVLGEQKVIYYFSQKDNKYNQEIQRKHEVVFTVVDTKAPLITFKTDVVEVKKGEKFDALENVATVEDPVDGALEEADSLAPGKFVVESDVNNRKAGDYNVFIQAQDKNGNISKAAYVVKVKAYALPRLLSHATSNKNYIAIQNYLMAKMGLNKAASSGILANFYYESKFDPNAGSTYYGLAQWGGSRRNNLSSFADTKGLSVASLEAQLGFLEQELNGPYESVYEQLKAIENTAEGAAEAAHIFVKKYEGAGITGGRAELAEAYFEQ